MAAGTTHRSEVFALADRLVEASARRDPVLATDLGIKGQDHLLPRYDGERYAEDAAFAATFRGELGAIAPGDDVDRIAAAVIDERLANHEALAAAGESARTFGTIHSPVSEVRQVFELMATDTREDLDVVAARLHAVPGCLASWQAGLEEVAA